MEGSGRGLYTITATRSEDNRLPESESTLTVRKQGGGERQGFQDCNLFSKVFPYVNILQITSTSLQFKKKILLHNKQNRV